MTRMNTTHLQYAAPAAVAIAVAALAAPLGAIGADDTSGQSTQSQSSTQNPSSTSSTGSSSTQGASSSKSAASGSSAKQQGKGKVAKRAASANDQPMADRVATALSDDTSLNGATILVIVDGGQVALGGTTADTAQSAHAMDVAQSAAGPAVMIVDQMQPQAVLLTPVPTTTSR
jgi:hypothetical protein